MSFGPGTGFLKSNFSMSALLCLLGLIVLGTMIKSSYWRVFEDQSICLILGNLRTRVFHSSACVFATFVGFIIATGGAALFGMDYVTWKRSERFKGRRASIAALLIAPTMSFSSFSTAIVIGVGITDFCSNYEVPGGVSVERCHAEVTNLSNLKAGVTAATLAGFLAAFYGFSEYTQYRKRHVQGDKVTEEGKGVAYV
ncbi:hypothetical protein BGZ99_007123 [Dissophora globulifera]|uniref:Uncharacterized protein n=1 Tax=Dissophora globulifera TaxID=979702 RepID=A0A9P6RW16_9FUNG|nr:hypothetical protein BGZ99_007123 [Dissophora globulifera]